MKRVIFSLIMMFVISYVYGLSAKEILDKVENNLSKEKDRESIVEVILYKEGKEKERREMRIWSAGNDKRVAKFISPESVKNVGILTLPNNEMYVYLPAYKKVRAVQGSMKDQNFQGTDFSYREMGGFDYSEDFDPKILSEDSTTYTLELVRKPNSDWSYDRILMVVLKDVFLPKKLEMYEKGKLKKVLDVLETEKKANYFVLSRIRMTSIANNTSTEIISKDVKFDQGLEARGIFSQRFLER
ncbi:MAG: outer membrane lipoprotein-sorting protein [Brevinematales bacterium]|nr:outer membrane lipoprotein-sorting protein [Brevinematales bacterium]